MLRVDPAVGSWGVRFGVLSGSMRHRKQRRQVPLTGVWGVRFGVLSGRMRHRKQRRQVPLTGVRDGWKETGNPERVDTARSSEIRHAAV